MKQPSRKKKNVAEIKGTGKGIRTCNECPFLLLNLLEKRALCNASDVELEYEDEIIVPDWCGNKEKDYVKK